MKRILLIVILLFIIWVLTYALAYTQRHPTEKGWVYPLGEHWAAVLVPLFEPLYQAHAWLDPKRPARDHS